MRASIAGIELDLPESTPEREALRDKMWQAWDAYTLAVTEQQRKARRRICHAAQAKLAEYDKQRRAID